MRNTLLAIAIFIALVGCNASKHFERFLDRHPELQKDSSVVKKVTDTTKAINETFKARVDSIVELPFDVSAYLDGYPTYGIVDTMVLRQQHEAEMAVLKKKLLFYINNHKCIRDTFSETFDDSLTVKVWQTGREFHIDVKRPESVKTNTYVANERKIIVCPPCETSTLVKAGWYVAGVLFLLAFRLLMQK